MRTNPHPFPPRAFRVLAAATLLLATATPLPSARADDSAGEEPAAGDEKPPERLERWPEPGDPRQLELDLRRLRKAATAGMEQGGREGLLAEGAAAAPALLAALGRERDETVRARLCEVLERITDARHTRLLAREFTARADAVRRFALQQAARFPDPGVRPAALAALERARTRCAKAKARAALREANEELYLAALCATSSGALDGLDVLFERARREYGKHAKELRVALSAVRGPEATARVLPRLESADRRDVETALRLLAACGEGEAATARIAALLDSDDNTLRVAAINALRGIVDGDPPLERLSVFEAIERAKRWKARL